MNRSRENRALALMAFAAVVTALVAALDAIGIISI